LIERAEAWAVERGCPEFASDALIDNGVSAAAHRALGFEDVEQIRCFWKPLTNVRSKAPVANPFPRLGDVVVRHATMADSDALAGLVTELGYRTSPDQMRGRLESILSKPEYSTLVALVEDQIAGFIGTMVRPSYEADGLYAQIMALVVAGQFRRRGVGRALVAATESSFTRRGIEVLVVNTSNHRADAHAFYERLGYVFTGRRYIKGL
jgi:ribosomal protein S18 acetylase RimI-like enzyme